MKVTALLVLMSACLVMARFVAEQRTLMETDLKLSVPEGWKDFGAAPENMPLSLTLSLKQQNLDVIERELRLVSEPKSASYGKYWSIEKINEVIRPTEETRRSVISWLNENGIPFEQKIVDYIKIQCTVEQAQRLLNVQLNLFLHVDSSSLLVRALSHYSIPSDLVPHINLISGVLGFPRVPHGLKERAAQDGPDTTPETIQKNYNITLPAANPKNLQAVASFLQQYYNPKDLQRFEQRFGLPLVPIQQTIGYNDPNKPGIEASLDVQYLLGVGNCSITTYVYSTNGTMPSGNEPFLDFLTLLDSEPTIPYLISMSYQDLEYTVSYSYAVQCNSEFMKSTLRGTTFITGSGDWGVGCEDKDHCNVFTADFPSSSPYVVSTGATTASTKGEIGVDFSSGGFSNYFGQPSYQTAAVNGFLSQTQLPPAAFFNASGRAFPDVAAIGTNFIIYSEGIPFPIGGTSAATPTFGSILSMINSLRLAKNLPTLGWVQPFLYQAWASNPQAFQDITDCQKQMTGCCPYSFTTVAGWDPVTGLGTPNFGVLASIALDSNFFNF
eukprot:TRINITY_DN3635_c0_g1_i1.p1 TRINITY_DN3635_c0_g1~~TRINITY_DN3635_c0_g1_i1.p1  ORF type:complete len:554 (+),score=287.94 TRINITY_DN3635_c0_g1_i1:13-1674(+)